MTLKGLSERMVSLKVVSILPLATEHLLVLTEVGVLSTTWEDSQKHRLDHLLKYPSER